MNSDPTQKPPVFGSFLGFVFLSEVALAWRANKSRASALEKYDFFAANWIEGPIEYPSPPQPQSTRQAHFKSYTVFDPLVVQTS